MTPGEVARAWHLPRVQQTADADAPWQFTPHELLALGCLQQRVAVGVVNETGITHLEWDRLVFVWWLVNAGRLSEWTDSTPSS